MRLSNHNALALLVDINHDIEEYAEAAVKNIIEDKNFERLTYPPNWGFTDAEKEALAKLGNDEHLKNALRKIIADSASGVIFNLLNSIDGTGDPRYNQNAWTGVKLVDAKEDKNAEPFTDILHDAFYETYWEWRKLRGGKEWKLDTYEE
jgi:hypothetical protein